MTPRHDSSDHPSSNSLERRLLAYSAAAGVALAGAAAPNIAQAQGDPTVVVTDVDPDAVISGNATYVVDLDNDGTAEFFFVQGTGTTDGGAQFRVVNAGTSAAYPSYGALASAYVATAVGGNTYAKALSSGEAISSNQSFGYFFAGNAYMGTTFPNYPGNSGGDFPGKTDVYFGLRTLLSSDAGSGDMHYAWVRIDIAQDLSSATIFKYAYEQTPNEAINAGELPVELSSFTAQAVGHGAALLKWQTLSETGNAGFEVQMKRKLDGAAASFEKVGYVPTNVDGGTTTEAQDYSFRVSDLDPGTYQFRLKQIDRNGNSELHGVDEPVSVEISLAGSHTLSSAYPNPFGQQSRFDLNVAETQEVTVELYNTLGQKVRTLHSGMVEEGVTRAFTIEAGDLASGVYIYRIEGETFADSGTVTLVR